MMTQKDNKVEVEILCKWNDNFHSDQLEQTGEKNGVQSTPNN